MNFSHLPPHNQKQLIGDPSLEIIVNNHSEETKNKVIIIQNVGILIIDWITGQREFAIETNILQQSK